MSGIHSIRTRLTLWYAAILFFGFGVLGSSLWFSLHHALTRSVDDEISRRIDSFSRILNAEEILSERHIQEELDEFAQPGTAGKQIQVFDPATQNLFTPTVFSDPPNIRDRAEPGTGFQTMSWRGLNYRVLTASVMIHDHPYQISAASSLAQAESILRGMSLLCSVISPFVVLLACLGGWWISRKALVPVQDMTRAAKRISIHNLADKLAVPQSGDEIQDLAETWNQTLGRLQIAVSRLHQFTADASHELRSPVAYIRATAELSLRRDRAPEEYRDALGRIEAESERMTALIQDLLSLARWDAGVAEPIQSRADLTAVVREVTEHMSSAAQAKGIGILAHVPSRPVVVIGDEQSLRRLLLILTDNAIKYSEDQGRIRLSLREERNFTELSVSDTGIGIPEPEIAHIFDRFYRVSRARTFGEGSGLGLALAQHIVAAHGAEIRAISHSGKGSKFTVRFAHVQENLIQKELSNDSYCKT